MNRRYVRVIGAVVVVLVVSVGAACSRRGTPTSASGHFLLRISNPSLLAATTSVIDERFRMVNGRDIAHIEGSKIRVEVENPSQKNLVLHLATTEGRLDFRAVDSDSAPPCHTAGTPKPDQAAALAEFTSGHREVRCFEVGPSLLGGSLIAAASAEQNKITGLWQVDVTFTPEAAGKFDAVAATLLGRQLAVVVDNEVISAPTIHATTFNGKAQISGSFTQRQAADLAAILQTPPLPTEVVGVECFESACGSTG